MPHQTDLRTEVPTAPRGVAPAPPVWCWALSRPVRLIATDFSQRPSSNKANRVCALEEKCCPPPSFLFYSISAVVGQHQIAPNGRIDARCWAKARLAPFCPSIGTHLRRFSWMAAGVRYCCSLASCLHSREILGSKTLCTSRAEHGSQVVSSIAPQ